jgi:hypothetical protein
LAMPTFHTLYHRQTFSTSHSHIKRDRALQQMMSMRYLRDSGLSRGEFQPSPVAYRHQRTRNGAGGFRIGMITLLRSGVVSEGESARLCSLFYHMSSSSSMITLKLLKQILVSIIGSISGISCSILGGLRYEKLTPSASGLCPVFAT